MKRRGMMLLVGLLLAGGCGTGGDDQPDGAITTADSGLDTSFGMGSCTTDHDGMCEEYAVLAGPVDGVAKAAFESECTQGGSVWSQSACASAFLATCELDANGVSLLIRFYFQKDLADNQSNCAGIGGSWSTP